MIRSPLALKSLVSMVLATTVRPSKSRSTAYTPAQATSLMTAVWFAAVVASTTVCAAPSAFWVCTFLNTFITSGIIVSPSLVRLN